MPEWKVTLKERELCRFTIEPECSVVLGRGRQADLQVDNPAVSRLHVRLHLGEDGYLLEDLDSANGTFVNGRRIGGACRVTPDDRLEFAKFRLEPAVPERRPAAAASDLDATVYVASQSDPGDAPSTAVCLRAEAGPVRPRECPVDATGPVRLGRDGACDVHLGGWGVGRSQCLVFLRDGQPYIIHQGGWRRTRVNGRRIVGETLLKSGDRIKVGNCSLRISR